MCSKVFITTVAGGSNQLESPILRFLCELLSLLLSLLYNNTTENGKKMLGV